MMHFIPKGLNTAENAIILSAALVLNAVAMLNSEQHSETRNVLIQKIKNGKKKSGSFFGAA